MKIIVDAKDYNLQEDKRLLIPYVNNYRGHIGFVNKRGHVKIAFSYDAVYDDFYSTDDVVRVGCWGVYGNKEVFVKTVIKSDGKDLFKERYKEIVMSDDRQRFVVENLKGRWAVLNREEHEIVSFGKYDWIDGFRNGFARVKLGKTTNGSKNGEKFWGIINTEGKEILPVVFPNIHAFLGNNDNYITIDFFEEEKVESIYTEGYFEPLPCTARIKHLPFSNLCSLSATIGSTLVDEMKKEKEKYRKRIEEYNKSLPEVRQLRRESLYNRPREESSYYYDYNKAAREQIGDAYDGQADTHWNTD